MTPLAQSALSRASHRPASSDADSHAAASSERNTMRSSIAELTPHAGPTVLHAAPAPVFAIDGQGAVALDLPSATISPRVLLRDAVELFKIKVVLLVVVTAWGGYHLGALQTAEPTSVLFLLQALLGIGLVSGGAGALNEVIERRSDALMRRTANRPLAANRVSPLQGWIAGASAVLLGALWLELYSNSLTAALALATALVYTFVYTPLKSRTRWATFVGAFPGAMGPMLGWTAVRGQIEWPAIALFAILFVWQFPHFMSIAWLYRDDYARAGIRMLPVVQPDGVSTVVVSLVHAVAMIPVSLLPYLLGMTGTVYALAATLLGLFYLACTIRFARILKPAAEAEGRRVARQLLRASVLYLPLLFGLLVFTASQPH